MSRLDELIKELCPDGVEYKSINDLIDSNQIYTITPSIKIKRNDYKQSGLVPIISQEEEYISGYYEKSDERIVAGEYVCFGDHSEHIKYINFRFVQGADGLKIMKTARTIKAKYYYYAVCSYYKRMNNYARHFSNFKAITIPIPPLPIQEEIVKILDKFTDYVTELQAELQARKLQYQHYLDAFYDTEKYEIIPLASLGSLTRGKRFVHADATDNGVPCVHYGELYTYYGSHADAVKSHIREELRPKMRYADPGDVIIVGAGENNIDIGVGLSWEGKEPVAVHDACYTLKHSQNSRYISYYLRSSYYHNQIKRWVSEGKICSISAQSLGKALIPIPPIDEQNRIAEILCGFEELCNDIVSGLPAEIEARQKQYEYYRDKLLSFKEIEL